MHFITVRNVRIGEGMPKIIAPIIGKHEANILAEAVAIRSSAADIAEWRIDHYESGCDALAVISLAKRLRDALGDMPLLVTFRTQKEGGAAAIPLHSYTQLLTDICCSGTVDMIDVEAFSGEEQVRQIIEAAHERGIVVIASNHDFCATPPAQEIVRRLCYMARIGADIPKIAVMPASKHDVLTLLSASTEAADQLDLPIITMSMGKLGAVSRWAGECFGSSCTFGSVGRCSAPGQIPVFQLQEILRLLHAQ